LVHSAWLEGTSMADSGISSRVVRAIQSQTFVALGHPGFRRYLRHARPAVPEAREAAGACPANLSQAVLGSYVAHDCSIQVNERFSQYARRCRGTRHAWLQRIDIAVGLQRRESDFLGWAMTVITTARLAGI